MNSKVSQIKRLLSFFGPGFLIAVGYVDPGNWATDLSAGSQFGYRMIFVILLSNIMAVHLQYLSLKLGVVTNLDLAQACKRFFPFWINIILYILCEIAIMAMDLAEIIGTAIALNLLFKLPIPYGILLTGLDVFVVMAFWKRKTRYIFELFIILLMSAVSLCFLILVFYSKPVFIDILKGFIPSSVLVMNEGLFLSLGIIGATVMPHNLYLHSHLVKFRAPYNNTSSSYYSPLEEKKNDEKEILDEVYDSNRVDTWLQTFSENENSVSKKIFKLREAIKFTTVDSTFCLSIAFFINSFILIVSSANFYARGLNDVADIKDAYNLLNSYLGLFAATLFAIALLASGQSSTITGTLAGTIVMEGFLGSTFKLPCWLRRIVTRFLAIVPAMCVSIFMGETGINQLLVLSQVILSMQLPFAIWPLIYFTSSKLIMNKKEFTNNNSTTLNENTVDNSTVENLTEIEVNHNPNNVEENNFVVHDFTNNLYLVISTCLFGLLMTGLNMYLVISQFI
ncbi:hypothetical protein HDU92_000085 [Lobulomyces angularis]|nr:hypothetical protein HDU92_000085 [Lobulomyces angularis]